MWMQNCDDYTVNQIQSLPAGFFFLTRCCSLLATWHLPASFLLCSPPAGFTSFLSAGRGRKKTSLFSLQREVTRGTSYFLKKLHLLQSRTELNSLLTLLLHFFRHAATNLCRALNVEGLSISKSTSMSSRVECRRQDSLAWMMFTNMPSLSPGSLSMSDFSCFFSR